MVMSLGNVVKDREKGVTYIGSMLFSRCCSGARIVSIGGEKKVQGIPFKSYGAHCDEYLFPYLTIACSIGASKNEIDSFMKRLDKALQEYKKSFPPKTEK